MEQMYFSVRSFFLNSCSQPMKEITTMKESLNVVFCVDCYGIDHMRGTALGQKPEDDLLGREG